MNVRKRLTPRQQKTRADLLALAAYLDKVPSANFDYRTVANQRMCVLRPTVKLEPDCGATACAVGYMTRMPRFRKLGLRIDKDASPGNSVRLNGKLVWFAAAAARVLHISRNDAEWLFAPNHEWRDEYGFRRRNSEGLTMVSPGFRALPEEVAQHIRNYVRIALPDRGSKE